MSALEDLLKKHRQRIATREAAAFREMLAAYEPIERELQSSYRDLQKKIKAAQAAGETISPSWFYRERRLKLLLEQVREQIERFGRNAAPIVEREQREAIRIAIEQERETVRLVAGPANSSLRDIGSQLSHRVVENAVGMMGDGSPILSYYAENLAPAVAEKLKSEVIKAAAMGTDFSTIARRLAATGEITRRRALTMARTEVNRVRREAKRQFYEDHSDVISGWEWIASKSTRTCVVCLAMDGTVHKLKEEFPQHINCLTAGTIVCSPETRTATRRFYEGDVVEIETSSGLRLTVTPNHPIMTRNGWVAADPIEKGNYVVGTGDGQRVCIDINPHVDNKPSVVDQIFIAAMERRGMISEVVPHSPANFHGDGKGSDVDVIFIDRHLRRDLDSAFGKPAAETQFISGREGLGVLAGQSPFDELFMRHLPPSDRIMSGLDISSVFPGRPLFHHHAVGIKNRSDRDAYLDEATPYHLTRHSEMFSEGVLGGSTFVSGSKFGGGKVMAISTGDSAFLQNSVEAAGSDIEFCRDFLNRHSVNVSLDRVVKVSRYFYRGHVFNLETSTGYYIANGIVTHNCRCNIIAVIDGVEREPRTTAGEWFHGQPADVQEKILGKDALAAYKRGDVDLSDFVGYSTHPAFGVSVKRRKLADALGKAVHDDAREYEGILQAAGYGTKRVKTKSTNSVYIVVDINGVRGKIRVSDHAAARTDNILDLRPSKKITKEKLIEGVDRHFGR
ncbi:MAG: hypothetical protein IT174_10720 [Acidobacteria bacterium]|nr:hypothetical protein [Acidobacteriota bacterium]